VRGRSPASFLQGAVLGNGEATQEELRAAAHLCVWAAGGGCDTVSLYQQHGSLLASEAVLLRHLAQLRETCCPQRSLELRTRVDGLWCSHKLGTGEVTGLGCTVIQLLSQTEAGDDLVLGAIRSLAQDVATHRLAVQHITLETISSRLSVQSRDPELVLCFDGPTRNGFLPWHIRTTEFFECCELQDFRFADYAYLLGQFAKVEQRFGA
jgi:hypothetical protein